MNTQLNQHFLIDENVINKLIMASHFKKDDIVVEIGPGTGNITKKVLPLVKRVIGIEIDINLKTNLEELKQQYQNLEIVYGNVINMYIPKCTKIISNLPFSIIEPFIYKLIRCDFEEAILIVGDNYASSVINGDKNNLSLLTNAFFEVQKIGDISPDSFTPRPRTKASILILKHKSFDSHKDNLEMSIFRELYFRKNKKIKNSLVEGLITYNNIIGNKITKKEAKNDLNKLMINNEILNKKIDELSNKSIKLIYDSLGKITICTNPKK